MTDRVALGEPGPVLGAPLPHESAWAHVTGEAVFLGVDAGAIGDGAIGVRIGAADLEGALCRRVLARVVDLPRHAASRQHRRE